MIFSFISLNSQLILLLILCKLCAFIANSRVVNYDHILKSDYCTLGLVGLVRMRNDDETEYIKLDRFEQEYKTFGRLLNINTFKNFRKWKAFIVWRKNVKYRKFLQCKQVLEEMLFIVNSSLRPALLNVREMCYRISDMGLCKVEKGHTYTLDEFMEAQIHQLNEVAGRLGEFRELVKEVVRSACRTALLEAGFTPDDYFIDGRESTGYGGKGLKVLLSSL